ncbi:MAG: immune inhibitor A [Candidatus Krumholzibacteriota bacterium]|nr:immune inhibitor A [Candidatus Krumholzibacteriota bacterium]
MKRIAVVILLAATITAALRCDAETTTLARVRLSRDLSPADLAAAGVETIASYPDGRLDVAVTDEQLAWLRNRTFHVRILARPSLAAAAALDANLGLYHTVAETEAALDSLAAAYPALTRIDTLGWSVEGRPIRAIKISDDAAIDEDEPEVLLMGCHHARELMSVEVPLLLAGHLLGRYGESPAIAGLVDGREIWIVPIVNPDGHVYVEQNHAGDWWTWWRKNRRDNGDGTFGIDLNRNYSYRWGYDDIGSSGSTGSSLYRGPAPFSEPETRAVRDFCAGREFSVALSYHSYGELIIYPWGYDAVYTDDHDLFSILADTLRRGNGYAPGCTAEDILYPTNGDTDDWAYGETAEKGRFFSFTVELNSFEEGGFAPPEGLIGPTFDAVLELNLALIRRAGEPRGVLGPRPPAIEPVTPLAAPSYLVSWKRSAAKDPNPAVRWDVWEIAGLGGVEDSCEAGDVLWEPDGFVQTDEWGYALPGSWYSGRGNDLASRLEMRTIYPLWLGDTLRCMLWYDIEDYYDFFYLEASLDDGLTWETVPGNLTTDADPFGANRGEGITGSSEGWVEALFLLDRLGVLLGDAALRLRFSYHTDSSISGQGVYLDLVSPVADCESFALAATAVPDTFLVVTPVRTGTFHYLARGIDAEGHAGRRSRLAGTEVDRTTPADLPSAASAFPPNRPNPFNPSTIFRYVVGAADAPGGLAAVRLELYDAAGRRIATIDEGPRAPGSYAVRWDGTNASGRRAASGVYFARLLVGGRRFARKAVLLR